MIEDDMEFGSESIYSRGINEPHGRIYLSGQQAIVRLLLAQSAADKLAGIKSAGFISGYRGSPLGGLDKELWKVNELLEKSDIKFLPAINEDLAATSLLGTQRVETDPKRLFDGVFGIWYGKGPGLDRAGDAIKHGNAYGSSPSGGVLVVVGDDHGCVSSSMSHQSDSTLIAWGLAVIHPSGIEDYERCGLWGLALSRLSGLWVGFKAITETVEASVSVETRDIPKFTSPNVDPGPDGLHWRWPDLPGMQIERRVPYKLKAARSFIEANPLDMAVSKPNHPVFAIAAIGKTYHDVREAVMRSGISLDQLEKAGVALLKINLVYPLSPLLEEWAKLVGTILIVEEKEPVVEKQLKQAFYNENNSHRVVIIGKTDSVGKPLISCHEEIRPSRIAHILEQYLAPFGLQLEIPEAWLSSKKKSNSSGVRRTPYFCSGCPHNTSTNVPHGSEARLGIGCHALAARMPERTTSGSVQMGGEGADWLGQAPFVDTKHIFQNIGDGTFFHSGCLAIRQAIASNVNITYKLLYNDAVAMTGGQPIDGKLSVAKAAKLVKNEGAHRVVIVTDDLKRYKSEKCGLPREIEVYHRDRLSEIQFQLRKTRGVSVLIYDQVCAVEKRRRKKRHVSSQEETHIVINQAVCEGCGVCQIESNCLSIYRVDSPFGPKCSVDVYSCNLDMSCLKGYCPSFLSITGKKQALNANTDFSKEVLEQGARLALPQQLFSIHVKPFEMLMVGEGGTGVVTVARLLGLAAHIEGCAVSVLDFTGFAQKGGVVRSSIRIATDSKSLHQYRIDQASADFLLAADLVGATEDDVLATLKNADSFVIANTGCSQTGEMLREDSLDLGIDARQELLKDVVGIENYQSIDARQIAQDLLDPMQANILLLGYAWQCGAIPLPLSALERAFVLQGAQATIMRLAFTCGRICAAAPNFVENIKSGRSHSAIPSIKSSLAESLLCEGGLQQIVDARVRLLTEYQNARYSERYNIFVEEVRDVSSALGDITLAKAVAHNLYKIMAYKDEYEVARLHTSDDFLQSVRAGFHDGFELKWYLRFPMFWKKQISFRSTSGLSVFGGMVMLLKLLSKGRILRQTRFDPFGRSTLRREERRLICEYERTLMQLLPKLSKNNLDIFLTLANVPDSIRGFGRAKLKAIVLARKRQEYIANIILNGNHHESSKVHERKIQDSNSSHNISRNPKDLQKIYSLEGEEI